MGFSPDIILYYSVDPLLLTLGNPFNTMKAIMFPPKSFDIPPEGENSGGLDAFRIFLKIFKMPTSYQKWVWEREAHINWSMVMQRQHELP